MLDGTEALFHPNWQVVAFLLEAIARSSHGEASEAGRALERALDLAEPEGTAPRLHVLSRTGAPRTPSPKQDGARGANRPGSWTGSGVVAARRRPPSQRGFGNP